MKHWIHFVIEGRFTVEVEADSMEKAVKVANETVGETDFNLDSVNWKAINAEDESGNFTEYCEHTFMF